MPFPCRAFNLSAVGPDGEIVFDLVAEVTQCRTVSDSRGAFEVFGGATVIIWPKGEVRYVIAKNILKQQRLKAQREFIYGLGKRYWEMRHGAMRPVRNALRLMHRSSASAHEEWAVTIAMTLPTGVILILGPHVTGRYRRRFAVRIGGNH